MYWLLQTKTEFIAYEGVKIKKKKNTVNDRKLQVRKKKKKKGRILRWFYRRKISNLISQNEANAN